MFHAPFRRDDTDGVSTFAREPLFDHGHIVEVGGDEQLFGRLTVFVVELFNGRSNEFLVTCVGRMGPKEVFASDQEAAAYEENLEIDRRTLPRQTDHILIRGRR